MVTLKNNCSNRFKYDVNIVATYAGKILGIDKNVVVAIVNNDTLLNKMSGKDLKVDAFIYKTPLENTFLISMRKSVNYPDSVICHELVHVKQILDGRLFVDADKKVFTWMGRTYTNDTPYELRPWETEAMITTSRIMRKFKKEFKQF